MKGNIWYAILDVLNLLVVILNVLDFWHYQWETVGKVLEQPYMQPQKSYWICKGELIVICGL